MSRQRSSRTLMLLALCGSVAACSTAGAPNRLANPPTAVVALTQQHPALLTAQRTGRDLGALPAGEVLRVHLGLAVRNQAALDAVMASGTRLTPLQYAARFGPDPSAVASARRLLATLGVSTSWVDGATSLSGSVSAGDAERLFSVRIHRYRGTDGTDFFAPTPGSVASIPGPLRATLTGVTGLDNYPHNHSSAIRSERGVTPDDMVGFYDIRPLRDQGIDGTGQTIYFIELDTFSQAAFDAFSAKFRLPAQQITVVQKAEWGSPGKDEVEADLDVQVAHEIAPGAKLVVYQSGQQTFHTALNQIFLDHPGAVVSSSWGGCEAHADPADAKQYKAFTDAAAAQGASFFVASGDRGAYDCVPDGDFNTLSADLDAGTPGVTSVGGTTAFLSSSSNAYYREAAWGQPVEQWGSSGGISTLWGQPSWQDAPGVKNQFSTGKRETPDISANSDQQSGWEVLTPNDGAVGGTSAAAPFWAGVAALLNQVLTGKQLHPIGFANPVLYYLARGPAGLPAPPFHDITVGTNLHYAATPGWDFATGLGTPDVAALADDWVWYASTHPNGGTP